jgi:hypothetical protein
MLQLLIFHKSKGGTRSQRIYMTAVRIFYKTGRFCVKLAER